MQSPQGVTGIPPGLEYMSALDQIIVKQRIEILECEGAPCLQIANCIKEKGDLLYPSSSYRTARHLMEGKSLLA